MVGVGADKHTLGISAGKAKAVLQAGVGCRAHDTCRVSIVHPQALPVLTSGRFARVGPLVSPDDALETGLNGAKVQMWVEVAPREGIEPSSLVLIQSQAGPASRPTGERPLARGSGKGSGP